MNALDLQQNVPAKRSGYFYDYVCEDADYNPRIMRVP